jgi:hypothetical protein
MVKREMIEKERGNRAGDKNKFAIQDARKLWDLTAKMCGL